MKRFFIIVAAVVMMLSAAVLAAAEGYIVGKPFPDYTFVSTEGETVTIAQAAQQKQLTIVSLFSTWYPYSDEELSLLAGACQQREDQVGLIALASANKDDADSVKKFRDSHGYTFVMGCSDETLDSSLNLITYPLTMIIDREGVIRFLSERRFASAAELDAVLDHLLDPANTGKDVAVPSALVLDQNYDPVPGVTVSFSSEGGDATAVTDENGLACLPLQEPSGYEIRLIAAPAGYSCESESKIETSYDQSYLMMNAVKEAAAPEIEAVPDVSSIDLDGPFTLESIRSQIMGLDQPVTLGDGTQRAAINFDNAATTPAFLPVMAEVNRQLMMYGSVGRGFAQKSDHTTDLYNATRDKVLKFVNADPGKYTCFYVNNTTDGLNKLASALITSKDDVVLTTRIEHHANDLSWRERCKVIYAEVDEKGRVRYEDIERLLKENQVKYVSVTAASNVTGYVTDVHRVAKLAHQYGAKIIVDGAQIVAHRAFSMKGETEDADIDYFVFSAHKMYSPYGGGAVIGLTEELDQHMPNFYGGGTIRIVADYWQLYKSAPSSYEAGSPNYPGVIGLGKAIDILSEVGFDAISAHEQVLIRRLIDGLRQFDNVIIYGDADDTSDRVGVVTFNFSDVNSYILAKRLATIGGVATRRGAFCANPYVWRLLGVDDNMLEEYEDCSDMKTPGMIRISFGIYNTEEEVDEFLRILPVAIERAKADCNTDAEIPLEY